jgi:pimeloyl-ACP methyl ester carboxylesterase
LLTEKEKLMDKTIDIDKISLHYTVSGQGPDMILMHGWGCNTTTLASIERIAQEQHTVYNIDFPGFGSSTEPENVWGIEEYTQIIEKFIAKLGIKKPILLGHSFGGRVGILYSSRHDDVDKLILVDAAGIKPKRNLKYYFKVYSFKFSRKCYEILLGKEKAQSRIDKLRAKHGSSDYANSTATMRAILSKVVNEDLKQVMPKIACPTLLIWGENDTATPLSDAKEMEKLIPDAGLVSFPGCGHYSFLDNPYQFASVLRSFINA